MNNKLRDVQPGFQVFVTEGGEEVGAVRGVGARQLEIYIENAGDFVVESDAVARVHDGKVILDPARLESGLRRAIAHAHDREDPNL